MDDGRTPEAGDNIKKFTITETLVQSQRDLLRRVEALAQEATMAPKKIVNPSDLDVIASLVVQARKLGGEADEHRVAEKRPHLEAEREVDRFFATPIGRCKRMADELTARASAYQKQQAERQRREAEAIAARAREEEAKRTLAAIKAEEGGRRAHAAQHDAKAEEAATTARQAEATMGASNADLTRQRTASGVLATARTEWTFEFDESEDIDLERLRPYLKVEHIEMAIRAAIKLGVRRIGGIRIYEDLKAVIR